MKKNSLQSIALVSGFAVVLALGACSREEANDAVSSVTNLRGYYPEPCGAACAPPAPAPVVEAKPEPVTPAYVSKVTAEPPAPVKKAPVKKHKKKKKKAYDPLDGS